MRSNLMSALTELLPRGRAEEAARSISIMIDGLWLRYGLVQGGIDRTGALKEMRALVGNLLR